MLAAFQTNLGQLQEVLAQLGAGSELSDMCVQQVVPFPDKFQKAHKAQVVALAAAEAEAAKSIPAPAASPSVAPPAAEQAVPDLDMDDVDLDGVKQFLESSGVDMPAEAPEGDVRMRAKRLQESFKALHAKKKIRVG